MEIILIIIIFVQMVDESMVRRLCMENQYYTPRYTLLLQCISCISLYHYICCISPQIYTKYTPRYTVVHHSKYTLLHLSSVAVVDAVYLSVIC